MTKRPILALMLALLSAPQYAGAQEAVEFVTTDSVTIFAHLYSPSSGETRATIIAFHQAGSNGPAEYGPIATRLTGLGYRVLAPDQRSGGGRNLGGENRTVAALGREAASYCEAAPDLEAALGYVTEAYGGAIVVWGSSYSAALTLRLAAENRAGVVGALAFSPASGGPMVDCRGEDVSEMIKVPVLVLRPESEMGVESVAAQAELFQSQGIEVFVARPGVHGSSMLVAERVGGDVEPTWERVEQFLEQVTR
ncbi:MAG: dienelactone hydrolase family protein [Gemmatimonadota bacterium]